MVLLELLERSRRGASLTEGIWEFIQRSLESYPEYERRQRYELDVTT